MIKIRDFDISDLLQLKDQVKPMLNSEEDQRQSAVRFSSLTYFTSVKITMKMVKFSLNTAYPRCIDSAANHLEGMGLEGVEIEVIGDESHSLMNDG